MIRLFIALEIPEEVISVVLSERDKILGNENNIRWEPKEKLHITLKFLGDTKDSLVEHICTDLETLVKSRKPFKLDLNKFGVFRRGAEPKILWVGMKENKSLSNFVDEIEESFCKFGYAKEERKFKPHITLLRFRGNEDSGKILNLLECNLPSLSYFANKVSLIKSELKQTGSVYSELKSFLIEK
ncbi:MAG: RNA 2',3'-cyclic phosphodiesterase [Ignavibacteria bacterium]|nr:RNA 2',3'-cyclic phosphodiesterase [Ignavibacteria bacterium]